MDRPHTLAAAWFNTLGPERVFFCQFTQVGFLRLLTNGHVMEAGVKTQREAWQIYDRWLGDERIGFHGEPPGTDSSCRRFTRSSRPETGMWPDAYLAAVAQAAGLTLVTLDSAFRRFAGLDLLWLRPPEGEQ